MSPAHPADHSEIISVPQSPNLLNSARYHRGFQNFLQIHGKCTYQKLILPADASRQDTSNGVRVAYVNFMTCGSKTWLIIKY